MADTQRPDIPNLLTFDIEDWYHANFEGVEPAGMRGTESRFRTNVEALLQICETAGCRATFFVLGCVGEEYPDIVKAIASAGHEVASHGYGHRLAYRQTEEEFREDVKKSAEILQTITGNKVEGYRAPSWSIVSGNLHYLETLESLGFTYDASIFPVRTFLYGIPDAPRTIHRPVVAGRTLDLYEVPMSVLSLCGKTFGFSGGFYFRLFPRWLIAAGIRSLNRQGRSALVYLHPRELDPDERRLDLPPLESFIQYHNVKRTRLKLETLVRLFRFIPVRDYLRGMEGQAVARPR